MDPLIALIEENIERVRRTATDDAALLEGLTAVGSEGRRLALARRVFEATDNIVQHGPLRGYRLPSRSTWREADNSAKVLGLYEQEVQKLLADLSRHRRILVDLGGADGFYGVGSVAAGMFERSIVFEADEHSCANIIEHAAQAGVADRVAVYGAADSTFSDRILAIGLDLANCVVLIDVEGAEFDILTPKCLHNLRASEVIIEVHDFLRGGTGSNDLAALKDRAATYFNVEELRTGARDLTGVPLLGDHWSDTDRWLLCSEGRAKLMSWLWLSPK